MDITDDSDEEFIPKKRRDCKNGDYPLVISGITEIKSMVSDILQVNEMMSLPIGVVKLVRDAFMCKICRVTPMDPPIIATKCCNSLIGCEVCVNAWYDGADGLSKKCPHCNEPRGYANTFQFKGMDEFLAGMRNLIRHEEGAGNNSNNN